MTQIKITIDGDVVMDGDAGTWQSRSDDFIAEQLSNMANGVTPAPYMRALMLTIAEAITTQADTEAEITSSKSGWTLGVQYGEP